MGKVFLYWGRSYFTEDEGNGVMGWGKYKLVDICVSIADGDHQPPPKADSGIPFVTISNITSTNKFDFTNTMFVPQKYYDRLDDKRKAHVGDVLYSIVGSFGIPVFISEEQQFVFQRHIAILRPDKEKIIPEFLFYTMLSRDFYMKADAVALGAAQRTISLSALRSMEIEVPPCEIQKKIVNHLKPYDDLIVNNQKKIRLLEEAAQRLYKEWFVDLRFPGYEKCKIVDGMPEGWYLGRLDDVIVYHDTKRRPLSDAERAAMKGRYRYFGAAGILDFVNAYLFDGTYLLLGEDGTVITKKGKPVLQYIRGQFWVNNHAHVLTGKAPYTTEYIYMMFSLMGISDVVTGVAQPKISQGRLSAKMVLIPTEEIVIKYQLIVKKYLDSVLLMEEQNKFLKESRDILLSAFMKRGMEV